MNNAAGNTTVGARAPQNEIRIVLTKPREAGRDPRTAASEFTELAEQIRSRGLLRRRYGYYWTKLIAVPIVVAASITAFILIGDSWWQLVTAFVLAIVFAQIAFLGHDAAHRQIFKSGKWNDWVSLVLANLFVGMSYGWWQHKHTRHHANPNKLDHDPDIELPVVVMTPAEAAAKTRNPLFRWALAHQGFFFLPFLFLEGIALHASSVHRVFQRGRLERRWAEITFLSIHIIGYLALVFLVLSPGIAVAFLAVQLGVLGFYLGASFAPNHKGMPVVPHDMKLGFLRRQVLMSRNIGGGRILDTVMGGLNYQIEHHLFPNMPRPHLRIAAPLIADYCRTIGVRYTSTSLLASFGVIVKYISRVGLGERDVFSCPLMEQRAVETIN